MGKTPRRSLLQAFASAFANTVRCRGNRFALSPEPLVRRSCKRILVLFSCSFPARISRNVYTHSLHGSQNVRREARISLRSVKVQSGANADHVRHFLRALHSLPPARPQRDCRLPCRRNSPKSLPLFRPRRIRIECFCRPVDITRRMILGIYVV